MSTTAISSLTPLESALASTVSNTVATQTAVNGASNTGSILTSASSSDPADALTQDIVQLLKALASGDVSGAKTDLTKFKADLKAQSTEEASSDLAADATSLVNDLNSGNAAAEQTDVSKIEQDLQAQVASPSSTVPPSVQTASPLHELATQISAALSTGSTSNALQDVTSYLVQNGQGVGSLLNTTA